MVAKLIYHLIPMKGLCRRVKEWYIKQGLFTRSSVTKQSEKIQEEANEIYAASVDYEWWSKQNEPDVLAAKKKELQLEIGDMLVLCMGLCHWIGTTPEMCATMTLEKIENRKTKWVNGELKK